MEKEESSKFIQQVFSDLVKQTVLPGFKFPGGAVSDRNLEASLTALKEKNRSEAGRNRIVDFCICQVFALSEFEKNYLSTKWKISHSFGKRALERFAASTPRSRYYEDQWLFKHGLSREKILEKNRSRKQHPLFKFIYPEYEEVTKKRMQGKEVGFYVCLVSTLLWTPFSPTCTRCLNVEKCKAATQRKYGELYRIRIEEYNKKH
ncbi:MAG: hypothetical protein EZS26_001065 [Candidatus Ordinivivax streblomastigis]|uniref:Uncharacterized protein n=1 Tax=Candidatus Ordinivivax streblomastigis TaxID=2540710 RepID=A0A5M8P339_9BACT|nr:MAG: hypothetical protein EZS26_001065 [Candidatus Ordinivivax streblomastigis]